MKEPIRRKRGTKMLEKIRTALIENGYINNNWRIKTIAIERIGYTDFVYYILEIYKPKTKKPDYCYELYIDTVRELIFFDKSKFDKLK